MRPSARPSEAPLIQRTRQLRLSKCIDPHSSAESCIDPHSSAEPRVRTALWRPRSPDPDPNPNLTLTLTLTPAAAGGRCGAEDRRATSDRTGHQASRGDGRGGEPGGAADDGVDARLRGEAREHREPVLQGAPSSANTSQ
jgi:hypothetical protein